MRKVIVALMVAGSVLFAGCCKKPASTCDECQCQSTLCSECESNVWMEIPGWECK